MRKQQLSQWRDHERMRWIGLCSSSFLFGFPVGLFISGSFFRFINRILMDNNNYSLLSQSERLLNYEFIFATFIGLLSVSFAACIRLILIHMKSIPDVKNEHELNEENVVDKLETKN